ncbi:MAG: hypothetical protein RLZZ77_2336 [Bacteroidota bacterium]|jgi:hypothetical protein
MKKVAFFFSLALFFNSCDHSHNQETAAVEPSFFGEQFDPKGAITVDALVKEMTGKDSLNVTFSGKIVQTCRKAGCWMDVALPSGETMTVFMHDHNFAVPLEGADGLMATMNGHAYYDTLDVEYLRHLAEDAGKSAEEIEKITEPKPVLAFDAVGVMIEGYKAQEEGHEGHDHEGHDHNHEGHDHEGHDHEGGAH